MLKRLRWRLFSWLCKRPGVCNAAAYSTVVEGTDRRLRPDWMCQKDTEVNGSCWCGKLVDQAALNDD